LARDSRTTWAEQTVGLPATVIGIDQSVFTN